jgi:glucokinase
VNTNTQSYPRLLGDIGGTNARFAWQADAASSLTKIGTYPCDLFSGPEAVVRQYLSDHQLQRPSCACFGIANPVVGDIVQMTNHTWSFSIANLEKALDLDRLVVINDFTALALSLPVLTSAELYQIGGGRSVQGAALGVIGPGTGLGVSGLLDPLGKPYSLMGEGGHVTLAASSDLEDSVIKVLRDRFGHASAERGLSGPGLVNLYEAVCKLCHAPAKNLSAAQILANALQASDSQCVRALELFFSFLGSVAGNLALTLGARGGVYIGGGIVPRALEVMSASSFRTQFEAKGRFQSYLKEIPTFVITSEVSPALLGASRALDRDNC